MTWLSTRTTVMALDALPPVGRAVARVLQCSESVNWAGLAIDLESWRDMLLCVQPDVALIDPRGFKRTSAELIRLTSSVSPDSKIILFVPTIAEPIVQRWYDAGADACITKVMHPNLICEMINDLHNNTFERRSLAARVAPTSNSA